MVHAADQTVVWLQLSQILLSSSSDPTSKDRTSDHLIDMVERVHDAFDPILVDLFTVSSAYLYTAL